MPRRALARQDAERLELAARGERALRLVEQLEALDAVPAAEERHRRSGSAPPVNLLRPSDVKPSVDARVSQRVLSAATAITAAAAMLALVALKAGGIMSAMAGQKAEGRQPPVDLQRPAKTERAVFALG